MSDDLALRLRTIKDASRRSLREIERATHVSNSSLSRYLSGQATPPWNVVVALCRATGHDPRPLRPLWEDADRRRRAPGRPADPRRAALERPARNDLPRDVAVFTARRDEVDHVARLAQSGHTLAIDGMGGVGKTALAIHVAHRLTPEFPDCQLYLDLHGFTPGRDPVAPADALLTLLRALGVPVGRIPDDPEERSALWRAELSTVRAIVVLDNAADAEQVEALLPGAGRNTVLITSRRRLVGLTGVEPLSLAPLGPVDAAELFTTALGPGIEAAAETVSELMKRYGGLPLAIRVAAARLRHRPSWSVADLLDHPPSSDEEGVGRVIDTSLARLAGPQRRLFRLLGVFPGAVIDPFAAAVLADLPVTGARTLLAELVDANLLEEPRAQRYRFHDLIRERAAEASLREESAAERDTALERVTDFYLHCLQTGRPMLGPSSPHRRAVRHVPTRTPDLGSAERAMAWYSDEAATIHRIFDLTLAEGHDEITIQFALFVDEFLGHRGEMGAWRHVSGAGIAAAERRGDRCELADLRLASGTANRYLGRLAEAEADLTAALDLAVALDDTRIRISALRRLLGVADDRGDLDRVLDLRRQVLELPDSPSTWNVAFTVTNWGRALVRLGRAAEADAEASRILAGPHAADDSLRLFCLRSRGRARLGLGDFEAALADFLAAVEVSRLLGHVSYTAVCRADTAEALSALGRHAEALDEHEGAVAWVTDNGEINNEINLREAFGRTCLAAGDLERAEQQFRRCLALAEPRGFAYVAEQAQIGLARVAEASVGHVRL
ncbi:tetratricopeptide (TPR) repeat protein/transcriptional regulator with XRE-family HTH domain [Streptacidiphilus sp. MAP12-33]|uniref:ATP-binding protein n=1 Tax=Streptacidiphilus sp. MAP12-33 TaxID=3156266 RepID=UPI0035177B8F